MHEMGAGYCHKNYRILCDHLFVSDMIKRILFRQLDFARDLLSRHPSDSSMPPPSNREIFANDDGADITEEELTNLLVPFIRLGKSSGKITLTGRFDELTSEQKVLVILFTEKLRTEYMQTSYDSDEYLSPNKISDLSETKIEQIYPSIRKLEQKGILSYDSEKGRYCISAEPEKLARAKEIVTKASSN